jgi:hypothetical protein
MPTVFEVVTRLMPFGSNPSSNSIRNDSRFPMDRNADKRPWQSLPFWPPDVFAVAATLVNAAGCYANPRYVGGHPGRGSEFFNQLRLIDVCNEGLRWSNPPGPTDQNGEWSSWLFAQSALAGAWWRLVVEFGSDRIEQRGNSAARWWDDAFYLLVAADQASAGFGFISSPEPSGSGSLDNILFEQYARYCRIRSLRNLGRDAIREDYALYVQLLLDEGLVECEKHARPIGPYLPYTPYSQCRAVTAAEACVQPRTQTPQVGCTINNLSHHLALLPPVTEVRTKWMFGLTPEDILDPKHSVDSLNLLIVPFPFRIPASALRPGVACSDFDCDNLRC